MRKQERHPIGATSADERGRCVASVVVRRHATASGLFVMRSLTFYARSASIREWPPLAVILWFPQPHRNAGCTEDYMAARTHRPPTRRMGDRLQPLLIAGLATAGQQPSEAATSEMVHEVSPTRNSSHQFHAKLCDTAPREHGRAQPCSESLVVPSRAIAPMASVKARR